MRRGKARRKRVHGWRNRHFQLDGTTCNGSIKSRSSSLKKFCPHSSKSDWSHRSVRTKSASIRSNILMTWGTGRAMKNPKFWRWSAS